jgi:hypothetical protein
VRQLSRKLLRRTFVGGALGASLLNTLGLTADVGDTAARNTPRKGKRRGADAGGKDNDSKNKKGGKHKGSQKRGGNSDKAADKRKHKSKGKSPPCLANGQKCPRKSKKPSGKKGKRQGTTKQGCNECCSGFSQNGVCACRPDGSSGCRSHDECCSGVCANGICRGAFFS